MKKLTRTRLWQVRDDENLLGCCERADVLADLQGKLLDERGIVALLVLEIRLEADAAKDKASDREQIGCLVRQAHNAKIACPVISSLMPMTAVSATPGC
jgi:hypothetical protein